jgi:dihydropteroate synthase
MKLIRRVPIETAADRDALSRRVGRPVTVPVGRTALLVTGDVNEVRPDDGVLLPRPAPLELAGKDWEFGARPVVMGIVNVTPDSFSDGGKHSTVDAAVAHALELVKQGADWLDVGGESTRPGAREVNVELEIDRVVPVIARLRVEVPHVPLSVDTSKPQVAERAIEAGACLVNDITALAAPGMVELVARTGVAACLMHMSGTPRTMQQAPRYDDVVHDVAVSLEASVRRAVEAGVPRRRLLIDPGIGFGKSLEHNLALLKQLEAFRALEIPVLLGTSRKSFLGALTGEAVAERRVIASAVSVALPALLGAVDVVRVHDVRETVVALTVAQALRRARDAGDAFR